MTAPRTPTGHRLFVYYKARQADDEPLRAAALAMLARLAAAHPGLEARLLCRPTCRDGLRTWMETYTQRDGVSDALHQAIERSAAVLAPLLQGPRHAEVFVDAVELAATDPGS